MFIRGLACSLVLTMASLVHAGAIVTLQVAPGQTPTGMAGGWAPSQQVLVDVFVRQDPAGTAKELRHIQFDFNNSDAALALVPPIIHGSIPNPVRFFDFNAEPNCEPTNGDADCGAGYFFDSQFTLPQGERAKVVSATYYYVVASELGPNPPFTWTLPGSSAAPGVRVGQVQVNLPSDPTAMCYTLDALNSAQTNADLGGADFRFGFGTDVGEGALTTWRANLAAPNNIASGNAQPFQLGVNMACDDDPCTTNPTITRWDSVLTHRRTGFEVGPVALEITSNNSFSESRQGMRKIVVTFSEAINPATAIPANVTIAGRDVNQQLLNLSGITVSVAPTAGNTGLEINFNPPLPNFARYRVNLNNVTGAGPGCDPIVANNQRIFTVLLGDSNGNRNVQANDVAGARSLIPVAGTVIDPMVIPQVRSDANLDARITTQDVGGIRQQVGNNATGIMDP